MNNRREFLKLTGLAGIGLTGASILGGTSETMAATGTAINGKQKFNMCGYAAPAMETVRIGVIGIGNRGSSAVERISKIDGVDIRGLADLRPDRVAAIKEKLDKAKHRPEKYVGTKDAWKAMCERPDIDLIYITTPWDLHTPMAVYAMEHGKHVAVEVPAAKTFEECWQLVEASEKYKKHCMMLENCCYGFFELLTLNMAQKGFFGDIIHAEGAYIHDLLDYVFDKETLTDMWRLKENFRNGNLYPTHGLGPICQIMDINRGDSMDYLVSVSSNDFMMGAKASQLAAKDDFYKPYAGKSFRGNMNTTTIRTKKGRSIMVQHDVTSPRPYSRIHLVSGTKAFAQQWPGPARISKGEHWLSDKEFKMLEKQFEPDIITKLGELAIKAGGHGGIDYMMDWKLINSLRKGLPLDQDVYDAALWSSIGPLSESSVANRARTIDVPDFTRGSWAVNKPVDISINRHLS